MSYPWLRLSALRRGHGLPGLRDRGSPAGGRPCRRCQRPPGGGGPDRRPPGPGAGIAGGPAAGGEADAEASGGIEEPVAAHRGAVRPVRYCVASGTTIGLEPSRVANEDAHACLTGYLAVEEGPHAWAVLTVADGMGGMAAGEIASEEAVT